VHAVGEAASNSLLTIASAGHARGQKEKVNRFDARVPTPRQALKTYEAAQTQSGRVINQSMG
jgi:hypothetical protein